MVMENRDIEAPLAQECMALVAIGNGEGPKHQEPFAGERLRTFGSAVAFL